MNFRDPPTYYMENQNRGMAFSYQDENQHGGLVNSGLDREYSGMGFREKELSNGGPMRYLSNEDSFRMGGQGSRDVSNFLVDHLASFPQDGRSGVLTPLEALNRLKRVSTGGGIWAQLMSMKVTNETVTMANGVTMETIEEYPLEQISHCSHILTDLVFENLLIFTTKLSRDKVGAVHIFQCRSGEAPVISNDITRRLKLRQLDDVPNGFPPDGYDRQRREPQYIDESTRYLPDQNRMENYGPNQRVVEAPRDMQPHYIQSPPAQQSYPLAQPQPMLQGKSQPPAQSLQSQPQFSQSAYNRDLEEKQRQAPDHYKPVGLPQKSGVSKAVQNFTKMAEEKEIQAPVPGQPLKRNTSLSQADYPDSKIPQDDAKINRDVEVLNHCIEEVEKFVLMLKNICDTKKLLSSKKKKKGKKYDLLKFQSTPPSEAKITNVYQKLKHSFNLLGRLRPHITNPNSPDLVHYLMSALRIIVMTTGLDKAKAVVNPLLAEITIDLFKNCLITDEQHLWLSLGPNWLLTKNSPEFRDKYIPPYQPIFSDGWVPPVAEAHEREDYAARSAAAMVARMKDGGLTRYGYPDDSRKTSQEESTKSISSEDGTQRKLGNGTAPGVQKGPSLKNQTGMQYRQEATIVEKDETPKPKYAVVVYDYVAHNNKELTIKSGERVLVLDDSRRWWLVKNGHNEQGYVPSTVLEFPQEVDSSDSSSVDGSGSPSPPSTGYNTAIVQTNNINNNNMSYQNALESKVQKTSSLGREQRDEMTQTPSTPVPYITQEKTITPPPMEGQRYVAPTPAVVLPPPPSYMQSQTSAVPAPPPPPLPQMAKAPPLVISPPKTQPKPGRQASSSSENFQSELRSRLSTNSLSAPAHPAAVDIDVDVFIPLYKSSTADDVSRWLRKLKFTEDTVIELRGIAAKELFKMKRDDLIEKLGEAEGVKLFEELLVQAGAHTKHKTMTEFQKVLLQRMQKREDSEKQKVELPNSPTTPTAPLSQEDLQKKYEEQQALIKKQREELERLKGREPDKPTFSSFGGSASQGSFNFTSQSAHGKTKF